jgi:hypothetical protein
MMCLDPTGDDYSDMRIGADLLASARLEKSDLREIETWLTSFLADPNIGGADIKGLLNRTLGRYNPFEIGGRSLLEAVHRQVRTLV